MSVRIPLNQTEYFCLLFRFILVSHAIVSRGRVTNNQNFGKMSFTDAIDR